MTPVERLGSIETPQAGAGPLTPTPFSFSLCEQMVQSEDSSSLVATMGALYKETDVHTVEKCPKWM
jgi:hypothetical protein